MASTASAASVLAPTASIVEDDDSPFVSETPVAQAKATPKAAPIAVEEDDDDLAFLSQLSS